jgi:TM2 domain-containing membrane protein YozV
MKKLVLLSMIFVLTAFCSFNTKAAGYTSDENLIDQMFMKAPEVVNLTFSNFNMGATATTSLASGEKDAIVAIVLDFFLGGLGVHRFYLGTEVLTGVGYILTCGGIFGLVPLVDFVVLIIDNKDISKYVNNPKFFMWM